MTSVEEKFFNFLTCCDIGEEFAEGDFVLFYN
jgi:hypothetical protein